MLSVSPTVINSVSSLRIILLLEEVSADAPKVHPPILPDDAVKAPADVTLNSALAGVESPA